MQAAEAIVAEDGPDAATVKAVMARAKVGPGSFYARFNGKDALLEYVQEGFRARCRADVGALSREAWRQADLSTVVCEVVRRLVRGHAAREAPLRAVLVDALRRPGEPAMEQVVAMDEHLLDQLSARLDPEGHHRGPLRVALFQVIGCLRTLVLFPDESPFPHGFREEDLILELARTILSALGRADEAPETYAQLLRASASLRPKGERRGAAPPSKEKAGR